MTSVTGRITNKGQVTLPREIREQLGLESGDTIRFEMVDGKIRVYPERNFDFATLIGMAPLREEWDGLSACGVIEDLRGEPDERAAVQTAASHPDVTFLSKP